MAVEKEIEGENVGCGYSEVFLRRPAFRSPRPGAASSAPGRAGAEKTNDALGPNHDPIRLLC